MGEAIGLFLGGVAAGAVATFFVSFFLYFPFALWERVTLRPFSVARDPRVISAIVSGIGLAILVLGATGWTPSPLFFGWIIGVQLDVTLMRSIAKSEAKDRLAALSAGSSRETTSQAAGSLTLT